MKGLIAIGLLSVLFIGLLTGGRVSTITYGPGTPLAGQSFYADGTPYTPTAPQAGTTNTQPCTPASNNPFARFAKYTLSCGPQ